MSNALDHVAYLSQEIGPHPAGTEEEQQAALYIADTINQTTAMNAVIEDFNGQSGSSRVKLILSIVIVLCAVLTLIVQLLTVPCLIIAVIATVLYVLEWFGRPVLSRMAKKNISQNVVAKYEPGYSGDAAARRRKVVLVARYDSGKVRRDLKGGLLGSMALVNKVILGGVIAVPVLLLVRFLFFRYATGVASIIMTVLIVIAALCVLIGIVLAISRDVANFNEGANANASGVAVLLEVAARVGQKSFAQPFGAGVSQGAESMWSQGDSSGIGYRPVVHGEDAARESGFVPEGADLVYAAGATAGAGAAVAMGTVSQNDFSGGSEVGDPNSDDQSSRLLAAKAAIAAMTGKPVNMTVEVERERESAPASQNQSDSAQEEMLDTDGVEAIEAVEASLATEGSGEESALATDAVIESAAPAEEDDGVPAWFTAAKKKARKPEGEAKIERSRFAEAFDTAEAAAAAARGESADQDEGTEGVSPWQANQVEAEDESPMAAQLRQMRENIQSVQAPRYYRDEEPNPIDQAEASAQNGMADDALAQEGIIPSDSDFADVAPREAIQDGESIAAVQPADEAEVVEEALPNGENAFAQAPVSQNEGIFVEQPQEQPQEQPKFVLPAESLIASPESFTAAAMPAQTMNTGQVAPAPVVPLDGTAKQYAPLAAAAEGNAAAAGAASPLSQLSTMAPIGATGAIPSLSARNATGTAAQRDALLAALPTKSGILAPKGAIVAAPSMEEEPVGFASPSGTAAFAPVSAELAQGAESQDDLFVDDAEDSAYEDSFAVSGTPTGPEYVEMPKKRGLFGRFRKDKRKDEGYSAQEWLDVDEDFNAQDVGRERGGWESFREQEEPYTGNQQQLSEGQNSDYLGDTQYMDMSAGAENGVPGYGQEQAFDYQANYAPAQTPMSSPMPQVAPVQEQWNKGWGNSWNGGAFSGLKKKIGRKKGDFDAELEGQSGQIDFEDARYAAELDDQYQEYGSAQSQYGINPQGFGQGYDQIDSYCEDPYGSNIAESQQEDLHRIMEFHDINLSTEVWFVALGSQLDTNAGIKAFLDEHKSDLRGAVIVELDSLGAGDLCLIDKEGLDRPVANSSRMKRYVKKASQETGIKVGSADLLFANSASSYASEHGYQTLHLAGIADGKQAYFAQADDVIENVSEEILYENTAFVLSVLESI